jgi:hypothetical protein
MLITYLTAKCSVEFDNAIEITNCKQSSITTSKFLNTIIALIAKMKQKPKMVQAISKRDTFLKL